MNHARGYAAVFTANCKLYVAGGTVDKLGTKYAEDMNLVEVYSTTSTSTGGSSDGLRSMANGYWSRTKDILQNVSHVEAVVLYNPETKQESGMLMGGKKNPPALQSFQPRLADCSLVLLSLTHTLFCCWFMHPHPHLHSHLHSPWSLFVGLGTSSSPRFVQSGTQKLFAIDWFRVQHARTPGAHHEQRRHCRRHLRQAPLFRRIH